MDLSIHGVVQRHDYLPICPIWAYGPKTCQIRQHLGQTLWNPYLCNRWVDLYYLKFYRIVYTCSCATSWSFDLDLGFSRPNFEMLYLRNWRADWHRTKGMLVDRMLHPLCDFQLCPQPWAWLWIFKVNFLNSYIKECEGSSTSNKRDMGQ